MKKAEEFARDCMLEDLHNTMATFGKVVPEEHSLGTIFLVKDGQRPLLKILYNSDANNPVRFFHDRLLTKDTLDMKTYFGPEFKEHYEAYRAFHDQFM